MLVRMRNCDLEHVFSLALEYFSVMGISVEQWRAAIGSYNARKSCSLARSFSFFPFLFAMSMLHFVAAVFLQAAMTAMMLLILLSGDVERNPGPHTERDCPPLQEDRCVRTECNRSMRLRKVCPQCNTVVHAKRSVCDCGHAFGSKKRKVHCTANGEPENRVKCKRALPSAEESLVKKERDRVRKVTERAYETCKQLLHRKEQNRTHMASMKASETCCLLYTSPSPRDS